MLGIIKEVFVVAMSLFSGITFSCNAWSGTSLNCVSMNNEECKIRPEIININSNEPLWYLYSVTIDKWSGSCNNITDPYAKLCVLGVIKNKC